MIRFSLRRDSLLGRLEDLPGFALFRFSGDASRDPESALSAPPLTPEERLELARVLWDWEPHDGQRELLTLRLADGSEPGVIVAACGRRWGKTEAVATDAAVRLLTEPDLGQLAVAPTQDQAAALFEALTEKLDLLREEPKRLAAHPEIARVLNDLEVRRSPYPHIRRKSDRQTVFAARTAGRDGRNLRGRGTTRRLKRFRVLVDERAFVPDEAVERALKPMLATTPGGGQLVMISSPFGRRGGFYTDFRKGEEKEGRYRAIRLSSAQNPLVDDAFLAEMRAEMSDNAFRAEFLAEFVETDATVFPEDDIAACLCPDDYGNRPRFGVRYVAGVDFGRRRDWTVATVVAVVGGRWSVVGEGDNTAERGTVSESPSPTTDHRPPTTILRLVHLARWRGIGWGLQTELVRETLMAWRVRRVATDRTGIGDALSDALEESLTAARSGCEVDPLVFTSSTKAMLIDGLTLEMARRRLRFPAHSELLSELRRFEVVGVTAGGRERTGASSGHDDIVCAIALAVHAAAPLRARDGSPRIGGTAGTRATSENGERNTGEE
jgi:hypothetical protein